MSGFGHGDRVRAVRDIKMGNTDNLWIIPAGSEGSIVVTVAGMRFDGVRFDHLKGMAREYVRVSETSLELV